MTTIIVGALCMLVGGGLGFVFKSYLVKKAQALLTQAQTGLGQAAKKL